jgi:hypothetical protein
LAATASTAAASALKTESVNMNQYVSIDDLVQLITEPNRTAVKKILADNRDLFGKVQGSTHNHQAWPGGYLDHVTEVMNIAVVLFQTLDAKRPLPFSISDILLVVFLHDIEKPWKYELGADGQLQHKATMLTKADHQRFRMAKLAEYGVMLSDDHENGLKYAEGELDDYSSRERKMRPLAALAHLCDVTSARIWFDHPVPTDDAWKGARRTT